MPGNVTREVVERYLSNSKYAAFQSEGGCLGIYARGTDPRVTFSYLGRTWGEVYRKLLESDPSPEAQRILRARQHGKRIGKVLDSILKK